MDEDKRRTAGCSGSGHLDVNHPERSDLAPENDCLNRMIAQNKVKVAGPV